MAGEYYVGYDTDLEKEEIVLWKPFPCINCGYKIKKIGKMSKKFNPDNPRLVNIQYSQELAQMKVIYTANWCVSCYPKLEQAEFIFHGFSLCKVCFIERQKMTEEILKK